MAMAPSFDTVGWFADSPDVLRAVGSFVLNEEAADKSGVSRVLIAEDALDEADSAVAVAVEDLLARSADALPAAERERLAPSGLDAWREAFRLVQAYEVWQQFGWFVTRADSRPRD